MMKVIYSEMDTPAGIGCRLEAAGHAGYAPAGQDIVCAGASTVMQGLVYLLAGEENASSDAFDEPDGPRVAVSVDAPCDEWVKGAFELAKSCFVLLAERYPENIRFADVSRRGEQSMMDLQLFAAEATAACGGNREPRLGQRSAAPFFASHYRFPSKCVRIESSTFRRRTMLKRLRSAHPILFCILAEVLLLGTLFVTDLVFSVVLLFAGVDFTTMDTYLYSTLQELAGAAVMVLVLKKTGRAGILFRRGSGFFNGLLVGMYPLVLIGYSFFASLMFQRPENTPLLPLGRILTFLLSMMMVGVAEEFAFRGVIAQTLLEHYGTSRGGIWKACIVSGLLFGAAHLTNILGSAPFGVLMQCLFAAALGTLFAAIYFRTGNIWVTVFLHGMMDISSMLIGGLYGTTTLAESVSGYDLSMLYSVALYLIPMAFLLRKKKLPEVQLYWGGCVKK